MALLRDEDKTQIQERLEGMTGNVKLVYFGTKQECQFCSETQSLLEELTELSDKLTVEVLDIEENGDRAEAYGVDKAPATVLLDGGDKDYGVRYYGIPSGYEFASLLEDILMFSEGDSGLSDTTRQSLANLGGPVHMQVFVTPTCPYCPGAVRLAHQMAFESEKVVADMVEAQEFMELAQRHQVMGVPRTVINEEHALEGMMPEETVLQEVLKAV
jgi:glutaredoxin-like protein